MKNASTSEVRTHFVWLVNILITGSAGRIGSTIYHLFKTKGHHVIGLDQVDSPTNDYVCNLNEISNHQNILKNIDVIIHCAGLHAPHVGHFTDQAFHDINVDATMNMINIAAQFNLKHFVFTSTTALYGLASTLANQTNWITEKTTPIPRTIYHQTKLQAESMLEQFSASTGLPVTVLQMSRCFPEPVDLMTVYRLHRGIDARDVASAHWAAVNKPNGFTRLIISAETPFERADTEIINQNTPKAIKNKCPELFDHYIQQGWKLPKHIDRVYDASKAHKVLKWKSIHGFNSVIEQYNQGSHHVLGMSK